MRAVVQRVTAARVTVGDRVTGEIGSGLLVLLGVDQGDGPTDLQYIASKVRDLRIFADADGKMNKSVLDLQGGVLVVSQFTLYADTRKGRRPTWDAAAPGPVAEPLVVVVAEELRSRGAEVATGRFGADMRVGLVTDGPTTIIFDVD